MNKIKYYVGAICLSLIHIQMCIRDRKKGDAHFDVSVARIEPEQNKEYIYHSEEREALVEEVRTSQKESGTTAVSYTHLDVYKRQVYCSTFVGRN